MVIDSHVHVWTDGSPPWTHNDGMTTRRPDYPGYVDAVGFRAIEAMDFLSAEDKTWILGRTAESLYLH